MPDFSTKVQSKPENSYLIQGYYEYPTWDLQRELSERTQNNVFLPSEELAILLKDIINGLAFLQGHKSVHGNLRPKYISMRNWYQPYKILDQLNVT